MSTPLLKSVGRVYGAAQVAPANSLSVVAPEWAATRPRHMNARFYVRAAVAVVLALLAIALILVSTTKELPGENPATRDRLLDPGLATIKTANLVYKEAVTARRQARRELAADRAALHKEDVPSVRASMRSGVAKAARKNDRKRAAVVAARAELAAGLQLVDKATASPPTSDADLVRGLALAVMAIGALLGAVALVVPRPQPPLTFEVGSAAGSEEHDPVAKGGGGSTTGKDSGDSGPKKSADMSKSANPVSEAEPVSAQAVAVAVIVGMGVFGINNTGGLQEQLINLALPLAPLLGGYFARRRVTPIVNVPKARSTPARAVPRTAAS